MIEFFARLWRNVCLILESKASTARRTEELERRVYALEQDQIRILGVLRSQNRQKN